MALSEFRILLLARKEQDQESLTSEPGEELLAEEMEWLFFRQKQEVRQYKRTV